MKRFLLSMFGNVLIQLKRSLMGEGATKSHASHKVQEDGITLHASLDILEIYGTGCREFLNFINTPGLVEFVDGGFGVIVLVLVFEIDDSQIMLVVNDKRFDFDWMNTRDRVPRGNL